MTVTLHEATTFVISSDDGDICLATDHGLYFQDSRFLSRLEMRVDGLAPLLLTSRSQSADQALFVLTNPALAKVEHKQLGIFRWRTLDDGMHEDVRIENYGDTPARFELTFDIEADFVHIFDVKQAVESGERVAHRAPADIRQTSERTHVHWIRLGRGALPVETAIGFDRDPIVRPGVASFDVTIPPRSHWELWIHVKHRADATRSLPTSGLMPEPSRRKQRVRERKQHHLEALAPTLTCDHPVLERAYAQAARDMVSLRLKGADASHTGSALAAGIPWYMALFGRDSLVASYQTLVHDPTLARGTLRALARLQGTRIDAVTSEEPGKILHEDRFGPLCGEAKYIPRFPYYGSIDSTPLFLVTLAEYVRSTGDLALATELADSVSRAFAWITMHGDRDGDGLLEYFRETPEGLANQGWKDSWDSIRFRDGRVASGPIALVEVQGYVHRAAKHWAVLFDRLGDRERATEMHAWADRMLHAIDAAYWVDDRRYFAEALDGTKQRVDSITSNPGHLLWSDAVTVDRAKSMAEVLLSEGMFTGYGIRTMGASEGGYNPISYHNGSVWPHDTLIVAEGLVRYGYLGEAARIIAGMLAAASQYRDDRVPELFAGYPSAEFGTPIEYPSANRPQAWASGAIIQLTRLVFGLDVDAIEKTVTLRPIAIPGLTKATLRDVPLGGERVTLELRVASGHAETVIDRVPNGWRVAR